MTLKNAAWLLGAFVVLFVAYSAYNERRPSNPGRERLYEKDGANRELPSTPVEVVEEERPVRRQTTYARPDLVAPERQPEPPPIAEPAPPTTTAATAPLSVTRERGGRTVITNDRDGLRVQVQPPRTAPPPVTMTTGPPDSL